MAIITLPFGYPAIQGAESTTIIYQGCIAKRYTVPSDPRTVEQLRTRYLWGDVRKVLSMVGDRAHSFLRTNYGKQHQSNVYNYIVSDGGGLWNEKMDEFEALPPANQAEWEAVAPYLALWNDPGKVFYGMLYELEAMYNQFGGYDWGLVAAIAGGAEAAGDWWVTNELDAFYAGLYDDIDPRIVYGPEWLGLSSEANCYGGTHHVLLINNGSELSFNFYGRRVVLGLMGDGNGGEAEIYIDSMPVATCYNFSLVHEVRKQWVSELLDKGFHHLRLLGSLTVRPVLDYVVVFEGTSLKHTDWIASGHKFNFSAVWPFGESNDVWLATDEEGKNILGIGGQQDFG